MATSSSSMQHSTMRSWQQAAPVCNAAPWDHGNKQLQYATQHHEIMFPMDTLHLSVLLLQNLYKALHRASLRRMQTYRNSHASPTGIPMLLLKESPTGTCQQVYWQGYQKSEKYQNPVRIQDQDLLARYHEATKTPHLSSRTEESRRKAMQSY